MSWELLAMIALNIICIGAILFVAFHINDNFTE